MEHTKFLAGGTNMSLPRPLNWLRESDTSDDAEKVMIAANEVKKALADAQEKLSQMEETNTEATDNITENLQENLASVFEQMNNMGGVPRNQFIVSTWIPFFPPDAPDELTQLTFSAVPFPTPDLAANYGNTVMGVLQTLISGEPFQDWFDGDISLENVEDTPDDVIFHAEFLTDGERIGAIQCKFWQYSPEATRPGEGEEQGDWI